jgi:alcohol dehydrogenase class IV
MGKNTTGLSNLKAAEASVEAVRELLETLKVPYRLGDYGVQNKDIPKLVQGTMRESRFFALNPRDIKEEDLHSIYEAAF